MSNESGYPVQIGSIASNNNGTIGTINVIVKQASRKAPVEKYADGTIGRSADMRNYIRYLLDQYYKFKQADTSFGVDPQEHARIMKSLYKVINGVIKKSFGAYPYSLPEEKFPALVIFMHDRIDKTRLGRVQKKAGNQCYKTFLEHRSLGIEGTSSTQTL